MPRAGRWLPRSVGGRGVLVQRAGQGPCQLTRSAPHVVQWYGWLTRGSVSAILIGSLFLSADPARPANLAPRSLAASAALLCRDVPRPQIAKHRHVIGRQADAVDGRNRARLRSRCCWWRWRLDGLAGLALLVGLGCRHADPPVRPEPHRGQGARAAQTSDVARATVPSGSELARRQVHGQATSAARSRRTIGYSSGKCTAARFTSA